MSRTLTLYVIVHIQPFKGWEILEKHKTKEEAEARLIELQKRAPDEWLLIGQKIVDAATPGGEERESGVEG